MNDMQQKKKIQMEDEQERPTDIHLYSIVGEKGKDEYPNKTEGIYTELITNTLAIHPSLHHNKNSNNEYERPNKNKNKEGKSVSRIWFCVIIFILLLLILMSLATSVIISFASCAGDNQGNCNSLESSLNQDFIKVIKHKIEEIENNTKGLEGHGLDLLYLINNFLSDKINEINHAIYGNIASSPAPSCRAIYLLHPNSLSGYYWVTSSNGSSVRVYCEMIKSCGNITGGLTRAVLLNNETRPLLCIRDFEAVDDNTRCVRSTGEPGCSHIIFPLMNTSYSHICGTVEGSWFGHPDGFTGTSRSSNTTINDNYVDGISFTYGNTTNRIHIWTFTADENYCPRQVPLYVGNNYSCLLWNALCSSTTNPCSHTFFSQLHQPATEDIEMRLCRDRHRYHEGIYLGNLEIYVW